LIKVVIAEDVDILRNGLKTIIEQDEEIEICGLAANGDEAFSLCEIHTPDLVLMDMRMPVCDGETATKNIKQAFPEIKVLILTTFDDKDTVNAAMTSGADGYILKSVDEKKLVHAIKSTLAGISVIGSEVFDNIRNRYFSGDFNPSMLSEREREILSQLAAGNSNKDIAKALFLSEGTVRNLISNLLEKLKVKDRTQLAVFAVKNNFY